MQTGCPTGPSLTSQWVSLGADVDGVNTVMVIPRGTSRVALDQSRWGASVCQAGTEKPSRSTDARARSSRIMVRQMTSAIRRLRQRRASFVVLPSAICALNYVMAILTRFDEAAIGSAQSALVSTTTVTW